MTWEEHPAVRSGEELTKGERAADIMRSLMGSWPFVFGFLAVMCVWTFINTVLSFGGAGGFDPYPYILLNLMLSMIAGLQGAIILIAQKRADQIAAEEAHHTLHNTEILQELLEHNTELTREVHALVKAVNQK